MTLAVNEIFGPTIQGEGPLMGRQSVFVRLARCDLSCSWCDTPYTWDWERHDPAVEIHPMPHRDVMATVNTLDPIHKTGVVITGGEPLLQRAGVVELVDMLFSSGRPWVQIETNGRHAPPEGLHPGTMIVASPKLANSGIDRKLRIVPPALTQLRSWPAVFKFVVTGPADLSEVDRLVDLLFIDPADVWVMPEGTSADDVTPTAALADAVIGRGYNLSTRLHVGVWGGSVRGK